MAATRTVNMARMVPVLAVVVMIAAAGTNVTRLDPDACTRANVTMFVDHAAADHGGNSQDNQRCDPFQRFR